MRKKAIDWRKIAFILVALLVMLSMLIGELMMFF
jgi:hypothetical protein